MRRDAATADRRETVRGAAADWQRTGWIDELARVRIDELYPDDRVRAGRMFRILFFVLSVCALQGCLGILYPLTGSTSRIAPVALLSGLVCVAATEHLLGPLKRRQGGIESAFSAVAVVQLMIAIAIAVDSCRLGPESTLAADLCLFGLLLIAAAWRWGYSVYAVGGSVMLFVAAGRLTWGRLYWAVGAAGLFAPLLAAGDSPRLPPVLRRCAAAVLGTSVLAFYAAVNIYSLDQRIVESALWMRPSGRPVLPRSLSILLTAGFPVVLLILGIRTRRRLLINLALVLATAALITVRHYTHIAPLWVVLCAGGGALLAASTIIARYLNSGKDRERGGFTAEPLFDNPRNRRAFEMLASIATSTPSARAAPSKPGFEGGGGQFGGGGASGEF